MKKIESLTEAQQRTLIEYRARWLAIGRSTEPANRAAAEKAVTEMYHLLGKPAPRFWWSDGPAVGTMVRRLLTSKKAVLKNLENHFRDNLADNLRDNLANNLVDNLGDNLWANLRANLAANLVDNLGDNLWANLRANLRDNLWDNLWDNLRDNLWANLRANLRDNLWANLVDNLGDNLGDNLDWGFHGGASYETAWACFYQFPDIVLRAMHTEEQRHKLDLWLTLSESTGWWHPFDGIAFMCDRPRIQLVDANGQLHADLGPALLCRDGFPVYALHGVRMKPEYVMTPATKLDPVTVMKEENVDQRRELIRKIGIEILLETLPHRILDQRDDYAIIAIDFPGLIQDARYLKMVNPSVGCFHLEGIERECDTVEKALNWRAGDLASAGTWTPEQLT